ncbi:MAG: GGDEF domain-containing protein [Gammaproteobacteria bacterium]|nr:MAG: GGDEF domain-containing protein [Gammaproteobacteria bacterium]
MATLQQTKTVDLKRASYAVRQRSRGYSGAPGVQKAAQRITAVLQTTLDAPRVIEMFAEEARASVPFDAVAYEHSARDIILSLGQTARHACSYRLMLAGEELGQLTFTRRRRFSASETLQLEDLLCSLVYPLRNALRYHEAVRAAFMCPLTGVNNRATMSVTFNREIEMARRHAMPLSLIILDIDHFKLINDKYGHAAGDSVIKQLAHTVMACIRNTDMLFRYGGEEFTVLLSNTAPGGAVLLAERIRRTVEKTACIYNGITIPLTVSLGVAFLKDGDTEATLFERADNALYQAKYEGRNCARLGG